MTKVRVIAKRVLLVLKKRAYAWVSLCVAVVLFVGIVMDRPAKALTQGPKNPTSSANCVNSGGSDWSSPGNAFSDNNSGATASVNGTTTNHLNCTNFGFSIPSTATIQGFVVAVKRSSSSVAEGGSKDAVVRLIKGGVTGATDRSTNTAYATSYEKENHGGGTDLWGETWTPTDVNASNFGVAFAATKPTTGSPQTVDVDVIEVTVYYNMPKSKPILNLSGYIWENDDGANVNSNTAMASANTAVNNVKKGQRLTLRAQIKNTGTAITDTQKLGLFYDRNDGHFTKVTNSTPAITANGDCADTKFICSIIDDPSNTVGLQNSMAINKQGNPIVSYYDSTAEDLKFAEYVGSGGNCPGSNGEWSCTTIHATNYIGINNTIGVDKNGKIWIVYSEDISSSQGSIDLWTAEYVGSGGNCNSYGGSSAWRCTEIWNQGNVTSAETLGLDFDSAGDPWVSWYEAAGSNNDLWVAERVGGGTGSGCVVTSDWSCNRVVQTGNVGRWSSLAIDHNDKAWVSYYRDDTKSLGVANYVGSGGTGCFSSAWNCEYIDDNPDGDLGMGHDTDIAIAPDGVPWISYRNTQNSSLRVAKYVGDGSGGDSCTSVAPSTYNNDWKCWVVETANDNGLGSDIEFAPDGSAWVAHTKVISGGVESNIHLARFVGNGNGSNCASSDWACSTVVNQSGNAEDRLPALAFDHKGNAWISYQKHSVLGLGVAKLNRGGEIISTAGLAGSNGVSITASKLGGCIGGGTWNNGKWFETEEATKLSLANGEATAQCTEIAWTIDTSQAIAGQTYRFVVAIDDDSSPTSAGWRGLSQITNYPTLTIESDTTAIYSKDNTPVFANCDNTKWGCSTIDTTGTVGWYTAMAFAPDGTPWVSFVNSTDGSLRAAYYVGGGNGTGCTGGNTDWTCMTVHSGGAVSNNYTSIAFKPNGNAIISYSPVNTWVAEYVGTGGTGCAGGSVIWKCTQVDNVPSGNTSLAIDTAGNPWLAYNHGGDCDGSPSTECSVKVAQYVGTGGNCVSSEWNCEWVDDPTGTGDLGDYLSLAIGTDNKPWISYYDNTAGKKDLWVATLVGYGGTGCSNSSNPGKWSCTKVDDSGDVGSYNSISVGQNNKPWISYRGGGSTLKVATLTGTGTETSCTGGSANWSCTVVEGTSPSMNVGFYTSIAVDALGNPWVSHYRATTSNGIRVARYVGSGGSGCTAGVTSWSCEEVTNSSDHGITSHLAFDATGAPWIMSMKGSGSDLVVAKMHMSPSPPTRSTMVKRYSRSAPFGGGRYRLDSLGYSGHSANDNLYDVLAVNRAERPIYSFSIKRSSNTTLAVPAWVGKSTLAPSSKNIVLQVFRYGSVNDWQTVNLSNNQCSSTGANIECALSGVLSGTASQYYETDGSNYWAHFRIYQAEDSVSGSTFYSDVFDGFSNLGVTTDQQMRHGNNFKNSIEGQLN